jgi:glycosyltransferase involved in cell wall biosynthesis
MTICIVTQEFGAYPGGIARVYRHLAPLLVKAGHTVMILTTDPYALQLEDEREEAEGYTVIRLRRTVWKRQQHWTNFLGRKKEKGAYWLALGLSFRQWLIENAGKIGIDQIECTDYGGLACFLTGASLPPVSICAHGTYTQILRYDFDPQDFNTDLIRWLEDASFRVANGVIAHTESNADDIRFLFGRSCSLAPMPFVPELCSKPSPGEGGIVVAGRLQGFKGASLCAASMELVEKEMPGMGLQWIGNDTYTAPRGQLFSTWLGQRHPRLWQKSFRWHPALPSVQLADRINRARLVLVPSQWDAFNLVCLEAAAARRPLIVTSTTGAASLFRDQENALIVPPAPEALAGAIQEAWQDEALRERLSGEAAHALRPFTPEAIIEGRERAYAAAAAVRPSGSLDELWEKGEGNGATFAEELAARVYPPLHGGSRH